MCFWRRNYVADLCQKMAIKSPRINLAISWSTIFSNRPIYGHLNHPRHRIKCPIMLMQNWEMLRETSADMSSWEKGSWLQLSFLVGLTRKKIHVHIRTQKCVIHSVTCIWWAIKTNSLAPNESLLLWASVIRSPCVSFFNRVHALNTG